MRSRLHYGRGLGATVLAGLAAWTVMLVPAWLWSEHVVDVAFESIVGRGEGLTTGERILLYAGEFLLACLAWAVMAWITQWLYGLFQDADIPFWSTFQALLGAGILAVLVGYVFPFLGIVIAVFVPPAFVNALATPDDAYVPPVAGEQPLPDPRMLGPR
jgi:hypothetical protein